MTKPLPAILTDAETVEAHALTAYAQARDDAEAARRRLQSARITVRQIRRRIMAESIPADLAARWLDGNPTNTDRAQLASLGLLTATTTEGYQPTDEGDHVRAILRAGARETA